MTAIKFACICPHPPIIVHEVGRGREREVQRTIDSLQQLGEELAVHRPETVLLMATHGPLNPGAFVLLTSSVARGDFSRWGAPEISLRFRTDTELVEAIRTEVEQAELPLDAVASWNDGLDWSVTVPLYYLRCGINEAPITPMNVSFLSAEKHFQFGGAVRRAVDRLGRRTVIVASADLSHRLSDDGPYGYDSAGPELDRRIRQAVASWDVDALLTMDEDFRERAGDDAVSSLSFLMGALDGLRVRPRILSYEGPFGVGYMVAAVDILDDDGAGRYAEADAEKALGDPVPEPEEIVAAGARQPPVPLVRKAVATSKALILPHEPVSLYRFPVRRLR